MDEQPIVVTFYDDDPHVEAVLLSVGNTGLCKVQYGGKIVVRHRDRVTPLNDKAKEMLNQPF